MNEYVFGWMDIVILSSGQNTVTKCVHWMQLSLPPFFAFHLSWSFRLLQKQPEKSCSRNFVLNLAINTTVNQILSTCSRNGCYLHIFVATVDVIIHDSRHHFCPSTTKRMAQSFMGKLCLRAHVVATSIVRQTTTLIPTLFKYNTYIVLLQHFLHASCADYVIPAKRASAKIKQRHNHFAEHNKSAVCEKYPFHAQINVAFIRAEQENYSDFCLAIVDTDFRAQLCTNNVRWWCCYGDNKKSVFFCWSPESDAAGCNIRTSATRCPKALYCI